MGPGSAAVLRIAAGIAAVQGIAHGTLFLRAKPRHGPAEEAVVEAMRSHRFDFAGVMRSYWDFYFGYGIEAAAVCVVEAILFWQLAGIAGVNATLIRPIVLLFLVVNLGHVLLTARYFFWVPIVFDLAIAACLGWALVVPR